ncbi:hypothetical protein EDB84DRAFT_1572686 [Lactarius hengduanensis]|nr:hypothetical protein EDB84DRAFT_1572686 [Lactarius hengduanensis]
MDVDVGSHGGGGGVGLVMSNRRSSAACTVSVSRGRQVAVVVATAAITPRSSSLPPPSLLGVVLTIVVVILAVTVVVILSVVVVGVVLTPLLPVARLHTHAPGLGHASRRLGTEDPAWLEYRGDERQGKSSKNGFKFSVHTRSAGSLWIIFELIFAYSAFAAASLLIVLRIFAIWDGNKIAVSIAMSAWFTNVAFLIHDITKLRATWVPVPGVCAVLNIESSKNTVILTLVTDVILCLTMLVGLLRLRQNGTTMVALWNFLWRQGLICVFLATVVQIVPTVFISLNLNDPFDLMFQTPSLIVMSIAATRMYRSLTDFTSTSGLLDSTQTRSGRTTTSEPKRISTAPIPLDRIGMEVAVHRSYEEDSCRCMRTNIALDIALSAATPYSTTATIHNIDTISFGATAPVIVIVISAVLYYLLPTLAPHGHLPVVICPNTPREYMQAIPLPHRHPSTSANASPPATPALRAPKLLAAALPTYKTFS